MFLLWRNKQKKIEFEFNKTTKFKSDTFHITLLFHVQYLIPTNDDRFFLVSNEEYWFL